MWKFEAKHVCYIYYMLYVIYYMSVCLSKSCTLLKSFDGLKTSFGKCTSGVQWHCVRWWSVTSRAGKIWGSNPRAKHAIDSDLRKKDDLRLTRWHIDQRFRVLPNYFGSCFIIRCVQKNNGFHGILRVGLLYTCYFHNFGTNSFNLLNYYLSPMLFGNWFYL